MTYRIGFSVTFDTRCGETTPIKKEIDFDPVFRKSKIQGLVDPHTLVVKRRLNGRVKAYPVQVDERLYYGNRGWIAWRADQPQAGGEWWMEFALREKDGRLAPASYRPMVGVGDEIHCNGDRWHPIGVPGMHQFPIAVDFNGDGLVDIISTSHYSNTQGMPWAGVFFWRNIGTNRQPRFAPPMRLHADRIQFTDASKTCWKGPSKFSSRPGFISEYYNCCDVFDWFGTGRMDLITSSQQAGIRVYRNTGRLDAAGLPELKLALKLPRPKAMPPVAFSGFRVVDWDGSGRPSFIIGAPYMDAGLDNGQMWLMHNVGGSREKPKFRTFPFRTSSFWVRKIDTTDWRTINNFPGGRAMFFDYFDIDDDGRKELLILHGEHRPEPMIEVWRNAGTPEDPVLMQDGYLPWSSHYHSFGFRFVKNAAFDGCLLASCNSGAGIHYFKRTGKGPFDPNGYKDTGPLLGEGAKLRVEGYVRPAPIDRQNAECLDMVCGDEAGFLTLVRDIGTKDRPAFSRPRKITDKKGHILHLNRENLMHDNDLERVCGQLKPVVCDWDGDGKLDLIVGNNTNRMLWLRNYDPKTNTVAEIRRLKVRGLIDPFGWRKGQDVLDFDGDGRLEMIAVDAQQRFGIYRPGRGKDKFDVLEPPVPLTFTNGKTITTDDIPPRIYRYGIVCICAADWTGSGTNDLLVSTNYQTSLLENVGTNQAPKFKKPVPFKTPDGVIEISHHESQVVAWDWDRDGRLDLLIGGENGGLYLFHRDWLAGIVNEVALGKLEVDK